MAGCPKRGQGRMTGEGGEGQIDMGYRGVEQVDRGWVCKLTGDWGGGCEGLGHVGVGVVKQGEGQDT